MEQERSKISRNYSKVKKHRIIKHVQLFKIHKAIIYVVSAISSQRCCRETYLYWNNKQSVSWSLSQSQDWTQFKKITLFSYYSMRVVVLGAHSIRKEEKYSKLVRAVEKRFPHPNYDHYLLGNNLMLLKVWR